MPIYEVEIIWVDVDGEEPKRFYRLDAADNLAMATRVNAMLEALDNVSLGKIADVVVKTIVPLALPAGLKAAALPGAHALEAGKFLFRSDTGFPVSTSVPTYDTTAQVSGKDILYTTSAQVAALIDEFLDGGWTDERGDDIAQFRKAYKTFGGQKVN